MVSSLRFQAECFLKSEADAHVVLSTIRRLLRISTDCRAAWSARASFRGASTLLKTFALSRAAPGPPNKKGACEAPFNSIRRNHNCEKL
jgi:hypothetical protein